ncbi:glycosyltransferase family 4 protein [Parapedobacter sp. SGR-10]|uniref:glycosyltransferase family 4 protein n=1 Tax=Parapedobacter sp. SGR-10 TaxID=2710879 RepID=UPI00197EBC45|nr:glycosyltransferase family 4 protein [Parapedobacter sp. SGR-10]
MNKFKLVRITTVPISLRVLLKGQHRFMSENGFAVKGISSDGEDLHQIMQSEGIPVIPLEMTRTISPLKDIKSLWQFYKLCKKEKPTIVHSHTPKAGIVGMLGAKLAGVPIRLHTVAGLPLMEAKGLTRKVLDFVEKLTYSCATKVYPNSLGLYDFILENKYTREDKLKIVSNGSSNGIDTGFFSSSHFTREQVGQLRQDLGISGMDFVFVFVGRLVGDKGINELVEAFRGTACGVPERNVKLLLVGSLETKLDPLKPETLKEIETNPNIISVGFQKDVRPYFAISDALAFPSYREGFPNVVMQAGAMGLPSIVSDINGCNEIVIEGQNGTIVPSKNVEKLMEAMRKISHDKAYYEQLQRNARKMIETRYEQRVVWEALLAEYNSLLEQKGLIPHTQSSHRLNN